MHRLQVDDVQISLLLGLVHGENERGRTMPSVRRAAISLLRSSPSFPPPFDGGLLELSPVIPTGPMYESLSRLAKKSSLGGSLRMKEVEWWDWKESLAVGGGGTLRVGWRELASGREVEVGVSRLELGLLGDARLA